MKTKIYDFFNHPLVAFPLIVVLFALFFWFLLKVDKAHADTYSVEASGTVKTSDLGGSK